MIIVRSPLLAPDRAYIIDEYLNSTFKFMDPYGRSTGGLDERLLTGGISLTQAEASVIIPFDSEDDVEHLGHTLSQLNKDAAHQLTEVWVPYNVKDVGIDHPEIGTLNEVTASGYKMFCQRLVHRRREDFPSLLLRLRKTHIPARHNMNVVWRECLDMALNESIELQRPGNYPIMRFDADTNELQEGTLPALTQAIRERQAHLVKIATRFGWARPLRECLGLTPVQQAVHIYGRAKELIESALGEHEERIYHEESGSGATMDNWMRVMTVERCEVPSPSSRDCENRTFLRRAKELLDPETPPFIYLPKEAAWHSTSDRRMVRLMEDEKYRAWQLPALNEETPYRTYMELSHENARETKSDNDAVVHLDEVATMIGILWVRQEAACGRSIQLSPSAQEGLCQDLAHGNFQDSINATYSDALKNHRLGPEDWIMLAKPLGVYALRNMHAMQARN
jgi:hypothetical protein